MNNKKNSAFPADTTMKNRTFLNDPKIDAELYAYLQSISEIDPESQEVRVYKKNMQKQSIIATQILKCSSRNTVGNHLRYLIDHGYLIKKEDYYVLPMAEQIYFRIPQDTLIFLLHTMKVQVIKVYIYLGQRFKYKPGYVFTIKEVCEHTGVDYNHSSLQITHCLEALEQLQFVKLARFHDGKTAQIRLLDFSIKCPGAFTLASEYTNSEEEVQKIIESLSN